MLGKLLPVVAMTAGFALPMCAWAMFIYPRTDYAPGKTFQLGLFAAIVTSLICGYGLYFAVAVLTQH